MLLFCQFQAQFCENVNPICEKSFFEKIKLSTDICSNVLYIYTTNATVKEPHCKFCKRKINSDWLTYFPTRIFTFDDTRHLNPSSSRKWIIIQNKLYIYMSYCCCTWPCIEFFISADKILRSISLPHGGLGLFISYKKKKKV